MKTKEKCECENHKGTIFHQEIQSLSKDNQKKKEELFKKNLEKRVEANLKKTTSYRFSGEGLN